MSGRFLENVVMFFEKPRDVFLRKAGRTKDQWYKKCRPVRAKDFLHITTHYTLRNISFAFYTALSFILDENVFAEKSVKESLCCFYVLYLAPYN